MKVGFIGGGNMASAIIGGLLKMQFDKADISVSEPTQERCNELLKQFPGIRCTTSNKDVTAQSDLVILAVKPQILHIVCKDIKGFLGENTAIVSIAAGITISAMTEWLGEKVSIIRCMPNTPALLNEGATALYASPIVSKDQRQSAERVLAAVSKRIYWVENEKLLDVVTGVSGSGPAYFFLLIECIEEAGVKLGLPIDIARGLAVQTCLGAGRMAAEADVDVATLRKRVTSPNGTTQAAIQSAEASGIRELWMKAVSAATSRSEELGKAKL